MLDLACWPGLLATLAAERVRPGGRVALAVWDVPAKNPFFTAIAGVLAQLVPDVS